MTAEAARSFPLDYDHRLRPMVPMGARCSCGRWSTLEDLDAEALRAKWTFEHLLEEAGLAEEPEVDEGGGGVPL